MLMETKILEDTLQNAWLAISGQYIDSPDEATRIALNTLAAIIREVNGTLFEFNDRESRERRAIEVKEWIEWLKEYA